MIMLYNRTVPMENVDDYETSVMDQVEDYDDSADDQDTWYNGLSRTVKLAAQQRNEMIDFTNETNLLNFMDSLRKHNYKGLSDADRISPHDAHDCHCVHGNEACCH